MPDESQEDIVREIWRAFAAGDVEAVLTYMHLRVRCQPNTRPGRSVYEGHSGLRQMFDDFADSLGSFRVEVSQIESLQDRVLCRGNTIRQSAHGDVQTIPFEMSFEFQDGLVVSMVSSPVG